ncbi:protein NLRC5 [Eucyclogobius newberryi]|uniref:protein NLRC5 n=1 Tax=Eucyclogobius newberryi TaxID=166745 RepID=UPI003B5920A2
MEEEIDPDQDNANIVLDQEYSELLHILTNQPSTALMKLCEMASTDGAGQISTINPTSSSAAAVRGLLDFYSTADSSLCSDFLQRVCLLCENIPMLLESRLMSVSGNLNVRDISRLQVAESLETQIIKRPRIDPWEEFITSVQDLLRMRWGAMRKQLVMGVELDNVWVGVRRANRARERPDQTPGSVDQGSRTPVLDVECGSPEATVTLDIFLQGSMGKVTIVYGPPGSGKTVLMSRLGDLWAYNLGHIPSSHLFVLLEFRYLNLLPKILSFYELLFLYYPSPPGGEEEKNAILDYLLSNPEQSCWVLDGYDEFHYNIDETDSNNAQLDPRSRRPVAELISALLHRHLLPGCTIVLTCRVREAKDLQHKAEKVGELQPWNQHKIKEYVEQYFILKDNLAAGKHATKLLFSNKHLVAMSSIPGLCNISCICLEYLLQEIQPSSEDKLDAKNHKDDVQSVPRMPSTLTKVYLTSIGTCLNRCLNQEATSAKVRFSQRALLPLTSLVSHYKSELIELYELAWKGLETGKILFLEDEIPYSILDFSVTSGFISQTELRQDGVLVTVYGFIHLTVQEFLSALKIMTSLDDKELRNRLSLKTRWLSKSSQKTVFTNSLHLFLSGLASPPCAAVIALLTKEDHTFVQKRQETVTKMLHQMCHVHMTGPKVLELCHCVQETQDNTLSKELMSVKPQLELRNMSLSSNDLDALAFVVNSSEERNIGLDFRACSIDLDGLKLLSQCNTITYLSFHSRKYGDSFAEKLSTVLPKFVSLKKLSFCGTRVTATGAAHLASALLKCTCITELDLSGNNLKDDGTKHVTDILSKLPQLSFVNLGQNNTSLQAAVYLTQETSSMNVQCIYIDGGIQDLKVTFDPNRDRNSHKADSQAEVSLLKHKWDKSDMHKFARSLARYPSISVLNLSGGQWKLETFRVLVHFLPKFNITEKTILNDCCLSIKAVIILTTFMSQCTSVREILIRRKSPSQAMIVFCDGSLSKSLSLSSCRLQPSCLEEVLKSFGQSSALTSLDLSTNALGDEGIQTLLNGLSFLKRIGEINASNNGVTTEGVTQLAGAFCSHKNLIQVQTSHNGSQKIWLKFCADERAEELRVFRVNYSSFKPGDVTALCNKLILCHTLFELDLSDSPLKDDTIKDLVDVLPKMTSLKTLNLNACITSTTGALILVGGVTGCERVKSVQLSSQRESSILFDKKKQDHFSCRFSHFSLDRDSLGRLLETLQSGPQLSELDLSNNNLDDKVVKYFVNFLPELKIKNFINLGNNDLKQQGMLDVADTLTKCDNVSFVEVCLAENPTCIIWFKQCNKQEKHLRITGATLTPNHQNQLVKIMACCHCPIKLEMKNCFSDSVEEFVEMFESSCVECTVDIEESWIRSEEAVRLLCDCLERNRNINSISIQQTTLRLNMRNCKGPTQHSVGKTLSLLNLSLVDCGIHGSHLLLMKDTLQRCLFLTELDLSHNCLGESGAEVLCSVIPTLPKLTSLRVDKDRCVQFVKILCKSFLQCNNLHYLSLSGYVVNEVVAQMIASVLPRLKSINLSHCSWTQAGALLVISSLAHCQHIEELCFDYVQLDQESKMCLAQSLQRAKSLSILQLSNIATSSSVLDVLVALKELVHLKILEMNSWKMSDDEVSQLVKVIPLWTHLQKICLSQTLFNDQSGDKLLEALKNCIHLKELHISRNNLNDLTAARMALVFPSLTHLCVIDVSENNIGPKGSVDLAKAISCLKNLTKINLTSVGTSELCAAVCSLASCPQIQEVRMGWNNCGDDVAQALVRVLSVCQSLEKIDLECNRVSLVGAEALREALRSCPALETIRLWKNRISPGDAERISWKDRRLSFSST